MWWAGPVAATHLDGGIITYTRLFGNTYSIQLVLYEDCGNSGQSPFHPLSTSTTAFVRNRCGSTPVSISLSRQPSPVDLPNKCGSVLNICNGGMTKGSRQHQFVGSYTFPASNDSLCGIWEITWGQGASAGWCCHSYNNTLALTPGSAGSGEVNFFLQATLNNAIDNGNSSGSLGLSYAPFFCPNWPVLLRTEQGEPDGDSLAYRLVAPFTGYQSLAHYQAGLTATQPFLGLIDSVRIDQNTGDVSFKSSAFQVSSLTLERSEYRDGQLVGTIALVMRTAIFPGYCLPVTDTTQLSDCDSVVLPDGRVFYSSLLLADTFPSAVTCDSLHVWDIRIESPSLGGIDGLPWAIPGSSTNFQVANPQSDLDYRWSAMGGQAVPDTGLQTTVQWNAAGTGRVVLTAQINAHCVGQDSLEVAVSGGVGWPEQQIFDVEIYPNPAQNWVTITANAPIESMQLFHADGRLLQEASWLEQRTTLDVTALSMGLYVLRLKHAQGLSHHRLLIQP